MKQRNFSLAIIAAALVFAPVTGQEKTGGSGVYVLGTKGDGQGGGLAALWKNGLAQRLSDGKSKASAKAVFVSDVDMNNGALAAKAPGAATPGQAAKPDAEWIDLVERKCNAALATMQRSRDAIGELKQAHKGEASVMFITAASAAMANFANKYYEGTGMFIASYRAGEVSGARERFTEYHSGIASGLKAVSNGYKGAQSNMAAAGIPGSLVDTIAKAFSMAAKEIEDEVLPAIRLGH